MTVFGGLFLRVQFHQGCLSLPYPRIVRNLDSQLEKYCDFTILVTVATTPQAISFLTGR